jgi:nicotinate phosphoribosyltransferase
MDGDAHALTTVSKPTNSLVTPLLTDLYQITMTYAHFKNNRHQDPAIFELFFRRNPFQGEYTIFCGLDECLKFVSSFQFTKDDVEFLKSTASLKHCEPGFWDYLLQLDCSEIQLFAMKEGTVAFPRIPLIVVSGPLGVCQLLETTLLTLTNYPSLVATNAARMVVAARDRTVLQRDSSFHDHYVRDGVPKQCMQIPKCVEFGLRRAQGPDGGFSASKYSAVGGFDATSNVQAGKILGLPIAGTHAHAFVQAYSSLDEVRELTVVDKKTGETQILLPRVLHYRQEVLGDRYLTTNDGELAAFIAYASAFPETFLCLIDTYETLQSGLLNFCMVSLVLDDLGYTPRGIRLDSGDLAYLSLQCARKFAQLAKTQSRPFFEDLDIVASNDINEDILQSLNKQGHAITIFGIGTNLVTCQAQPALGCVYKLVEISGKPRIKLSQDIEKVLIPGKKRPYRLFGSQGHPLMDVMVGADEPSPEAGKKILCRHPFVERKRAAVTATKVLPLHHLVFDKGRVILMPELEATKVYVQEQLAYIRPDVLRSINATPYKISVSSDLFTFLHDLWQEETPVAELS